MLTKEEIIEYASQYIEEKNMIDFVYNNEMFYFTTMEDNKLLFMGYALCLGYELDYEAKPEGKWLYMNFQNFFTFPPEITEIKLQPPHIVTGELTLNGKKVKINKLNITLEKTIDNNDNVNIKQPSSCKFYEFKPKK